VQLRDSLPEQGPLSRLDLAISGGVSTGVHHPRESIAVFTDQITPLKYLFPGTRV